MPVLDITKDGSLSVHSGMMVFATMTYPLERDDDKRNEFVTERKAAHLSDTLKQIQSAETPMWVSPRIHQEASELLPLVIGSPSPEEQMKRIKKHARGSWIAGILLRDLLAAAMHHPELEINIDRGQSALAETLKANPLQEKRAITTVSGINKWWKKYRSVSHLWLGLKLFDFFGMVGPELERQHILFHKLRDFLAFSEKIRLAAVSHGFLKEEETWRVPDDLELPPVEHELSEVISPLSSIAIQALKDYKPPHASY